MVFDKYLGTISARRYIFVRELRNKWGPVEGIFDHALRLGIFQQESVDD
jgi:hypothetical protein